MEIMNKQMAMPQKMMEFMIKQGLEVDLDPFD